MSLLNSPRLDENALLLNGVALLPDVSGALFWPERETLIVADLHLEKGSSLARRGSLLPPYDTAATLAVLDAVIAAHRPRRVICLGDSFHDAQAAESLSARDRGVLRRLSQGREWVWIAGNHDPAPPRDCGGELAGEIGIGDLVLRHEAKTDAAVAGEISGHFHPKARVRLRGRAIARRCFVYDGRRLIMPSFGAYTGGLDVLHNSIAKLFPAGFKVRLLGRDRTHAYPRSALLPLS